MTLNDLKKEVLALMFETDFESYEAFILAANRALFEIHSEREIVENIKIHKKKLEANEHYERLSHEPNDVINLILHGKAFSFTVAGTGSLTYSSSGTTEEIDFSGVSSTVKRIIKGNSAFLSFTGDFDYDVYNLASFNFIPSYNEEDVPVFSSLEQYDMRKIDPLFIGFNSSLKDGVGKEISCLKTDGSVIFIPREYEGEILVSYKRMPRKISEDELDSELDAAPECSHLLALRCAAYLLLDGNEELSEYYLSLYKSGMVALQHCIRKTASNSYSDVLGWC
ncbi:MAG: hypothetical protein IJW38_04185 [Clostridia bacterium]|nr:hypothetical protein [Clostridia bacterium]